ncbi:MAG: class II glutamine amidotransferase [Planctomycetes bacterium]|nr:class II glutamine amidotransferase [Planctomycetota bacterium]MCB9890991.1 class II glutamine amidotransferase [Planctomycetota bacterium]MCB9919156.1 class II glutamine amidotransferase [Planctomycetota bacterium]
MCELFAMCSRHPADVTISIEELASHGGRSGPNPDGWGVAYYVERDLRLLKEAGPALESPCIRFLEQRHMASTIVMAHIRRASEGALKHANSQPFARELGGRMHTFAHNGDVPGVFEDPRFSLGSFHPVGETDSERAFCGLLARLTPLWTHDAPPTIDARMDVVSAFAAELRELGAANFLYADSELLFAHSDRRNWHDRLRPPGLHVLEDDAMHTSAVRVSSTHRHQKAILIASVPLSNEAWQPMLRGELRVFESGALVRRTMTTN